MVFYMIKTTQLINVHFGSLSSLPLESPLVLLLLGFEGAGTVFFIQHPLPDGLKILGYFLVKTFLMGSLQMESFLLFFTSANGLRFLLRFTMHTPGES
ncbi:hypothetical protein Cv017_19280 [Chromobacterium subtsugae]|nr:hypothetical protein Cv017_19280 [Chromobacterium subtsugae]